MKKFLLLFGLVTLSLIANHTAQAQFKNQYAVGANYMPEWQFGSKEEGAFHHVFGISAEVQFSKHSGLEIGVFQRLYTYKGFWDNYAENFTGLRLAYKFYSNIVNVKIGVMYDFGAKSNYWGNDLAGAYLSVSKDIALTQSLIFEPEVRYTFAADVNSESRGGQGKVRDFLGAGLKLKYRF